MLFLPAPFRHSNTSNLLHFALVSVWKKAETESFYLELLAPILVGNEYAKRWVVEEGRLEKVLKDTELLL